MKEKQLFNYHLFPHISFVKKVLKSLGVALIRHITQFTRNFPTKNFGVAKAHRDEYFS
jgi:hypothetical protein